MYNSKFVQLLSFGVLLLAGLVPLPVSGTISKCGTDDCDYDLVVIGCGWAGIGVGLEAEAYNVEAAKKGWPLITYKIYEADGECGGRAQFAHWFSKKHLIKKFYEKLLKKEVQVAKEEWKDNKYYKCKDTDPGCTGERQVMSKDDVKKFVEPWKKIEKCLNDFAYAYYDEWEKKLNDADTGLRDVIEDNYYCSKEGKKWNEEINPDFALDEGNPENSREWETIEFEYAMPFSNVSIFGLPIVLDDFYVKDKSSGARIARAVVAEYGLKVDVNKQVTDVKATKADGTVAGSWEDIGVKYAEVTLNDGLTVTAKKVVPTISAGVLQARGDDEDTDQDSMFTPALPKHKMTNLRNVFEMVNYKEIVFYFDTGDWPADESRYFHVETEKRDECHFWQNLDSIYPGLNAIVCTITTETWNDKVKNAANEASVVNSFKENSLDKIPSFSSFAAGTPCTKGVATDWDPNSPPQDVDEGSCKYYLWPDNEYHGGSYENWKPLNGRIPECPPNHYNNCKPNHANAKKNWFEYQDYWAPVPTKKANQDVYPALFISGTGTCDTRWGWQDGGLYAGWRDGYLCIADVLQEAKKQGLVDPKAEHKKTNYKVQQCGDMTDV